MTDITAKLRELSIWLKRTARNEPEPEIKASHIECADDCTEAADEIDRLRAEVAAFKEADSYINGELDDALEDARKYCDAQKEIARLREALSLALDEIRECDDTDGVRAKVIDVLAAMAEVGE